MSDDEYMRNRREAMRAGVPSPGDAPRLAGYVVWDEKHGLAYQGRIYDSESRANKVLEGVVWHSRDRYRVRPVEVTR